MEESHIPGGNEFTSDDSNKIVISSIEDIPVVDENSPKTNNSEKNALEALIKDSVEEHEGDDDAKALAEIEKEGEAYSARQKKKSNFSFEILSSKTARLRHLIQMNNSNKANNNGGVKELIPSDKSQLIQQDKTSTNLGTISSNQETSTSSKKPGNTENLEQVNNDSPVSKQKQQKPERTSRFGPSVINTENNLSTNSNLKFPKFLPKSNNVGGLLPLPIIDGKPNSANSAKYHSTEGLKDVETDSLGRMRRTR